MLKITRISPVTPHLTSHSCFPANDNMPCQMTIQKCKQQIWLETPLEWNDWPYIKEKKKTRFYAFPLVFEDSVLGMWAFKKLQLFLGQTVCLLFTLGLENGLNGGWKRRKRKLSLTLRLILK